MLKAFSLEMFPQGGMGQEKNIARIAKAASHKLPGKSSLNVNSVLSCRAVSCPVQTTMTTMTTITTMSVATMRKLAVI